MNGARIPAQSQHPFTNYSQSEGETLLPSVGGEWESPDEANNGDGDDDDDEEIVARIEDTVVGVVEALDRDELPVLCCSKYTKRFTVGQSRSFASILMVLSFCHRLLMEGKTTTTREVFYYYVTHFRNQRECDNAIWDAAALIGVPRIRLGLCASPKGKCQPSMLLTLKNAPLLSSLGHVLTFFFSLGWFCGCLEIVRNGSSTDARALSSVQGLPITREWLMTTNPAKRGFRLRTVSSSSSSAALCVLVVEKEGVYNRLSEDRFFDRFPCVLVTGKGFPDLATRALVWTLHHELQLAVVGLCDCNPYGIGVLQTYQGGGGSRMDGSDRNYGVPVQWLGLRPSHVAQLRHGNNHNDHQQQHLPPDVYQSLTDNDRKRLDKLCHESHPFHSQCATSEERLDELLLMKKNGYKVELEALHWLGMDYLSDWLHETLVTYDSGSNDLAIL